MAEISSGESLKVTGYVLRDGEGPVDPSDGFNGMQVELKLPDGTTYVNRVGFRPGPNGTLETYALPKIELEGEK